MNAGYNRYVFQGHSGYLVHPKIQGNGQNLLSIGHTALVSPWQDTHAHMHETSEELYLLRRGRLLLQVANAFITLQPGELLLIKPTVSHAILDGEGEIEHFGLRAPADQDKHVLGELPKVWMFSLEESRLLCEEWGHRIPLDWPQHQNCWLLGAGKALFRSSNLVLANLYFPTVESANAGIGTRHRLHLHQYSWEYYAVLEGVKTLQVEDKLVEVHAGEILEIPPYMKHTLHSRTAPFMGFTMRAPVMLDDKVEFDEDA